MQVIPVIDIRNGAVVRALAGRRSDYLPLVSPLAKTSAPRDVARGLMSLRPFRDLYIADVDAIEGRGDNRAAIEEIGQAFPQLRLWVDAGVTDRAGVDGWLSLRNVEAVLGSESFCDLSALDMLRSNPRVALSLDFQQERFLGDPELLAHARLWPPRVIVMTLARVGAGAGPDVARLHEITSRAQGRRVYAAGGVRDAHDLDVLEAAGAAGALVASSLHQGRLTPADLARRVAK